MESKYKSAIKVALSLCFGGAILYWMYRNFDFQDLGGFMLHNMNWNWMYLSCFFGILAQAFRAWRWRQALEPVGEKSRTSVRVNSIFFSYAISLIIPRIGEFARCGILSKYDKVSFAKAIGTVVTERLVDSIVILIIAGTAFLLQIKVFGTFFDTTGTSIDGITHHFSVTGWIVTAICAAAAVALIIFIVKRMAIQGKFKDTTKSVLEGITSLKDVKNLPLFIFFTIGIWASYFIQYYLTFFCFDFTKDLGIMCALSSFIIGSIAVLVPTPNGAGPWHFATKTMLVLYGVSDSNALYFVLIVHAVHTLLMILLGIYSLVALSLTKFVKVENS